MQKTKEYLSLFLTMLKIGLFTFGGGYAMIALLENEFVAKKKWIEKDEFLDVEWDSKDEIKKRLGRSPDKADAFVLTFAEPVYDYGKAATYGNGHVALEDIFASYSSESKW